MAGRDYSNHFGGLSDPAEAAVAVTPGTSPLAGGVTRGLYIGGAGSGALTVTMADGVDCAFAGLTANTILPLRVTHVLATGTDVTSIVALY